MILKKSPIKFSTSVIEDSTTIGTLPVTQVALSLEDQEILAVVRQRMNDSKDKFEEITLDKF